jgi:hypothetical protein
VIVSGLVPRPNEEPEPPSGYIKMSINRLTIFIPCTVLGVCIEKTDLINGNCNNYMRFVRGVRGPVDE